MHEFTQLVDEKSQVLINEFHTHFLKIKAIDPNADQRRVFEGWEIQKIAAVHVAISLLAEKLERISK